jgi:hypothetical protein
VWRKTIILFMLRGKPAKGALKSRPMYHSL